MKTTLNEIFKRCPCGQDIDGLDIGWLKLLKGLGKTEGDDEQLDLIEILKINGIKDAIWSLRCFDYLDYCLFLADIAESVLPIYEKEHEKENKIETLELCVQAIRDYKESCISLEDLRNANTHAASVYTAADNNDTPAATIAAATITSAAAIVNTATHTIVYAVHCADVGTLTFNAAYNARKNKYKEIEQLFIQHFGETS